MEHRSYCVVGHPVSHSRSPVLHNAWFKRKGSTAKYVKCDVSPRQFAGFMNRFRDTYAGANITIPHKQRVMKYLDEISPEARVIGAVNTVVNRGGKLIGYNTDVVGFLESLKAAGVKVRGREAVVLGAGGAARALVYGLVKSGAHVTVVNRTRARAASLAHEFGCNFASLADFEKLTCDFLVNATSVGMQPRSTGLHRKSLRAQRSRSGVVSSISSSAPGRLVSPIPNLKKILAPRKQKPVVMDIIYTPRITKFLRDARTAGCKIITGDTMFVEQARAAFELW